MPTASGVPLRLLPKEINGVRIIGIDVPGFGVPTHAEAKDVLAGAMLRYARKEAEQGPVQAPRGGEQRAADGHAASARCSRPIPSASACMLEPLGLAAGPVVPTREWRELYAALDCAVVAAIHPFYTASFREFDARRPPDRRLRAGRRRRHGGLARTRSATACNVARDKIDAAKNRFLPAIRAALAAKPDQGAASRSPATRAPSCWSRGC